MVSPQPRLPRYHVSKRCYLVDLTRFGPSCGWLWSPLSPVRRSNQGFWSSSTRREHVAAAVDDCTAPSTAVGCGESLPRDRCAAEPDLALRVNGLGTHNLALACLRCDAALLTVSTNEVFDGKKGAPYYEHERRNPVNAYARSKLAGEVYTQMHLSRFYIVRLAWLYARGTDNFPSFSRTTQIATSGPEGAGRQK